MSTRLAHTIPPDPHAAGDPCASCDARGFSVCNAIAETDLARLASIAVVTEAPAGQCFIDEGEPAASFFNIKQKFSCSGEANTCI